MQEQFECFGELFISPAKPEGGWRERMYYVIEALCDYVGLRLARDTYKDSWLMSSNAREMLFTYYTRTSFREVFSQFWAFTQCYTSTDFSYLQDRGFVRTHPPRFHRVNRGLSNFNDFQKLIKCDPPRKKIRCEFPSPYHDEVPVFDHLQEVTVPQRRPTAPPHDELR